MNIKPGRITYETRVNAGVEHVPPWFRALIYLEGGGPIWGGTRYADRGPLAVPSIGVFVTEEMLPFLLLTLRETILSVGCGRIHVQTSSESLDFRRCMACHRSRES